MCRISVFALLVLLPVGCILATILWFHYRNAREALKKQPIASYYDAVKARPSYCSLEDISADLKMMVIALEDMNFFLHHGFNWIQMLRMFWKNLRHGRILGGSSSITQQLAKNMYLTPEKTYTRKLTEWFLARKMEKVLCKEEILELYLNIIYYGMGQYGIGEASRFYFGVSPADITFNQALTLASLLPAPDLYGPLADANRFSQIKARSLRYFVRNDLMGDADAHWFQMAEYADPLDSQMARDYSTLFEKYYRTVSLKGTLHADKRCIRLFGKEITMSELVYKFLSFALKILRDVYHRCKGLRLRNRRPTIFANNCIGTVIYHDLGLPFLSPTINLTISHRDFMKFLNHLPEYLESDVYPLEVKGAYYPVGEIRYGEESVRLNFIHYASFEESRSKWNARKKRVDLENLFILEFFESAEPELIEEFSRLPYPNKCFVTNENPTNCDCVEVLDLLNDKDYCRGVGHLLQYKPRSIKRYLDSFDYISFLNRGKQKRII